MWERQGSSATAGRTIEVATTTTVAAIATTATGVSARTLTTRGGGTTAGADITATGGRGPRGRPTHAVVQCRSCCRTRASRYLTPSPATARHHAPAAVFHLAPLTHVTLHWTCLVRHRRLCWSGEVCRSRSGRLGVRVRRRPVTTCAWRAGLGVLWRPLQPADAAPTAAQREGMMSTVTRVPRTTAAVAAAATAVAATAAHAPVATTVVAQQEAA